MHLLRYLSEHRPLPRGPNLMNEWTNEWVNEWITSHAGDALIRRTVCKEFLCKNRRLLDFSRESCVIIRGIWKRRERERILRILNQVEYNKKKRKGKKRLCLRKIHLHTKLATQRETLELFCKNRKDRYAFTMKPHFNTIRTVKYISVGAVFYFNNRDSWPYWSRFLLYFLKIGANSAKINVYV